MSGAGQHSVDKVAEDVPHTPLGTLPDEIKSYIARVCAQQDAAVREAFEDASKRFATGDRLTLDNIARAQKAETSSLGTLFQVSKEWARLAAPFRFRTLTVKKMNDERFRLGVLHLRGHNLVEVDLTGATPNDLVTFAGIYPLLPAIKRVKVDEYMLKLQHFSLTDYARMCAAKSIRNLLDSAVHVTFSMSDPLEAFAHLDEVSLDQADSLCLELRCSAKLSSCLWRTFELVPKLSRLELSLKGDFDEVDSNLFQDVVDSMADAYTFHRSALDYRPPLTSLVLKVPDISPAVLQFASSFARTLQSLSVEVEHYDPTFLTDALDGPVGFIGTFERLTSLTLRGDLNALRGPLGSITDRRFPALKELHYLPYSYNTPISPRRPGEPAIKTPQRVLFLDKITSYNLKGSLERVYQLTLPPEELVLEPPLYPTLLKYPRPIPEHEVQNLAYDLQKTLSFLNDWHARAVSQSDSTSLARMAQALGQVDLERIAYQA
ncbi:hypothetical protein JCM10908_002238 [Rhodotorula pacifica]|uniref:uncharacterized protein n=1 Tax=Rhodotorula pacifica TaxID=1495444 RepID=UPI003171C54A